MGHRNKTPPLRKLARALLTVAVASTVGTSLALIAGHIDVQPKTWMQCFDDPKAASEFGSDASQAIMTVRSERLAEQRQLRANERALGQLSVDSRWADPEQQPWLELATEQTRAQITMLQTSEEEAGDTEGCLEQF